MALAGWLSAGAAGGVALSAPVEMNMGLPRSALASSAVWWPGGTSEGIMPAAVIKEATKTSACFRDPSKARDEKPWLSEAA